jgi:hypothetical protein
VNPLLGDAGESLNNINYSLVFYVALLLSFTWFDKGLTKQLKGLGIINSFLPLIWYYLCTGVRVKWTIRYNWFIKGILLMTIVKVRIKESRSFYFAKDFRLS